MKIKKCTCGKELSSRDVKSIGKSDGVLYLNCKKCGTTLVILSKEVRLMVYGKAS